MTKRTRIIMITMVIITTVTTIFAALYTPEQSRSIARPTVQIGIQTSLNDKQTYIRDAVLQEAKNYLASKEPSSRYRYTPTSDEQARISLRFMLTPEPRVEIFCAENPEQVIIAHTPYKEAAKLLISALREQYITNIGFITENKGDYKQLAKTLKTSFREGKFSGAVYHEQQNNFDKIINKLRNNDAQIFVLTGNPEKLDELIVALNNQGISNYQIASLYSAELSAHPELYQNVLFSGSDAGTYASKIISAALEKVIMSYEKNYQTESVPDCKQIFEYLKEQNKPDGRIDIPAASKTISKATAPVGE